MNHIIPIFKIRIMFGHTPILDNYWTGFCLTSRTSDSFGYIFFRKWHY